MFKAKTLVFEWALDSSKQPSVVTKALAKSIVGNDRHRSRLFNISITLSLAGFAIDAEVEAKARVCKTSMFLHIWSLESTLRTALLARIECRNNFCSRMATMNGGMTVTTIYSTILPVVTHILLFVKGIDRL